MPILVDCDWGRKNQDVSSKYKVRGYPTVIFADSEGKEIEKLRGRDGSAVAGQISSIAEKYTKAAAWAEYNEGTFGEAAEAKKPLLIFFTDGARKSLAQEDVFIDPKLEKALESFLLVRHEISKECDICKTNRVRKGPAIYFMDPLAEEPSKKPLYKITSYKSAKSLAGLLKMTFKRWEKALKKHEE